VQPSGPAIHRTFDPISEPIPETCDASSPTDLPPRPGPKHDLDALTCQPRTLVEPVLGWPRLLDPYIGADLGAARWRSSDRKREEHALVNGPSSKRLYLCLNANGPRGAPRRPRRHELGVARPPDLAGEDTRAKRLEAE
jgi:hypothetical protein